MGSVQMISPRGATSKLVKTELSVTSNTPDADDGRLLVFLAKRLGLNSGTLNTVAELEAFVNGMSPIASLLMTNSLVGTVTSDVFNFNQILVKRFDDSDGHDIVIKGDKSHSNSALGWQWYAAMFVDAFEIAFHMITFWTDFIANASAEFATYDLNITDEEN